MLFLRNIDGRRGRILVPDRRARQQLAVGVDAAHLEHGNRWQVAAAADSVLGALGALGPAFEHALPAQLAHHRLESDAFATLDPEGPGDLALAHRARAILDEGANLFPGRKRLGAGFGGRGRPVF